MTSVQHPIFKGKYELIKNVLFRNLSSAISSKYLRFQIILKCFFPIDQIIKFKTI